MSALALMLALSGPAPAAEAVLPPSTKVDAAFFIDLTDKAIEPSKTLGLVQSYIPASIPIDNLIPPGTLEGSGGVDLLVIGLDYKYGVEDLIAVPWLEQASLVPTTGEVCRANQPGKPPWLENGYLDLVLGAWAAINPSYHAPTGQRFNAARAYMETTVSLFGIFNFGGPSVSCDLRLDGNNGKGEPIRASIKARIGMPEPVPGTFKNAGYVPVERSTLNGGTGYCPFQDPTDYARAMGTDTCPQIDIGFADFDWAFEVPFDDIDIDCGWFANFIIGAAGSFGLLPEDLIEEFLGSQINDEIDAALADVETEIDAAIASFFVPEDGNKFTAPLDLLGTQLTAEVCARDAFVVDDGMRIELDGRFIGSELPHPCISRYDPGGSRKTNALLNPNYPQLQGYGIDTVDPEVVVGLDDDFLNQALYEGWRSGLLCQTLDAENSPFELPGGLTFDTNLMNSLSKDGWRDFFPVGERAKPVTLVTVPRKPPVLIVQSDPEEDVGLIQIEDLGINMYAEVDGRQARLVGLELNAEASASAGFDTVLGILGMTVLVDSSRFVPEVVYDELNPTASATFANGLATILQTIVGALLGDLLDGLQFKLPTFAGLGVQNIFVVATGAPNQGDPAVLDYLGVFGSVGAVTYGDTVAGGCDLFGGGGGSVGGIGDCAGGCSSLPVSSRVGWLLLPMLVAIFRRRED
ncbi:MAG: hypothetical protein H6732_14570 [Alphaproteobacteria bacterium]|nr:hypothetical protein [Alphaproteobacteria bacterium]